jgi:hypothetical protein
VGFHRRTIWIADAHHGDGKRFVARADEKLTALILSRISALFHSCYLLSKFRVPSQTLESCRSVKSNKDVVELSAPDERYVVAPKYRQFQGTRTCDKAICFQRSPTE